MTPIQELKKLIRDWGQRLEDLGPKLQAMKDDPESFTHEEKLAIVKEAEVVFAAFNTVKYTLNIPDAPKTIQ